MNDKVTILGEQWTIREKTTKDYDGAADKTSRTIYVLPADTETDLGEFEKYRKKVLRHEIIHAFLYECGLAENFAHPEMGHDETFVDWFAIQGKRIYTAWQEAGAL